MGSRNEGEPKYQSRSTLGEGLRRNRDSLAIIAIAVVGGVGGEVVLPAAQDMFATDNPARDFLPRLALYGGMGVIGYALARANARINR